MIRREKLKKYSTKGPELKKWVFGENNFYSQRQYPRTTSEVG